MQELVHFLARSLVDDPDPVSVESEGTPDDMVYKLTVSRGDLGKVIGKKGRTAKAMRTLLAAVGAKQKMRVTLEIVEPSDEPASKDKKES
jgi:predicted RNA-binding protein YlqC (UPF0109 family)